MEILRSSSIYKGAPAKDICLTTELQQQTKPLNEYDIIQLLKVNEQFVKEQQETLNFRLHGSLNLVSPLSNKPRAWDSLASAVQEYQLLTNSFTLESDFDVFLAYTTDYIPLFDNYYQQKLKILNLNNPFQLINCGFSQNIYKEKIFNYVLDKGIDITGLYSYGLPIQCPVTEVYLYIKPKSDFKILDYSSLSDYKGNIIDENSEHGFTSDFIITNPVKKQIIDLFKPQGFAHLSDNSFFEYILDTIILLFQVSDIKVTIDNILINKNTILNQSGLYLNGDLTNISNSDTILGNVIYFNEDTLEIQTALNQVSEIKQYVDATSTISLTNQWTNYGFVYKQNGLRVSIEFSFLIDSLVKIPLLDISSYLEIDTLNNISEIPPYSLVESDINQVKWRDVLSPGYIEPNSQKGFDYPFINGYHYTFNRNTIFMRPNLSHYNTFRLYKSALTKSSLENF